MKILPRGVKSGTMNDRFVAQYVADELLGEGAFGKVHRVHNQRAEDYALKVLQAALVGSHSGQLQGEVELLSRLNHPNLIRVFEYLPKVEAVQGLEGKGPGYVMEWVPGPTLDEVLKEDTPWEDIETWFVQCLRALHYLHSRHLLHGDLKPANLRLGAKSQIKILDFGLAGRWGEGVGEVMGTVEYMAPEALSGRRSAASDLFSLGVLFFHLLTGAWPFDPKEELARRFLLPAKRLDDLKTQAPDYFSDILARLLESDPERRLSSARNTLRALNQLGSKEYVLSEEEAATDILEHPPFVGREDILQQQEQHLSEWVGGTLKNPLWLIHGPAGVGRSRMVEMLGWQASLRGIEIHRPDPGHRGEALLAKLPSDGEATLVILTDLQAWSDQDRKSLVGFLKAMEVKGRHLGMILEWRDSPHPAGEFDGFLEAGPASRVFDMELGPLEGEASRSLTQEIFFEGAIPLENLKILHEISLGNPALLLSLLRWVQEKGGYAFLKKERRAEDFSDAPLPPSLREEATQVWKELSPMAQKILTSAYIVPEPLAFSDYARHFGLPLEQMRQDWERLLQTPWLKESGGKLMALSPPYRSLWLENLGKNAGNALHAEWLKSLQAQGDTDPFTLATLAWGAQDFAAFREYGISAAQNFVEHSRPEEALDLYEDLLSVSPTTEQQTLIYAYQAAALVRLARYDEALKAYDKWHEFTVDDGTQIQTLKYHYLTGAALLNQGKLAKAKEKFERALNTGDSKRHEHHLPFHLKSLILLGKVFEKEKDLALAQATYEKGLALARGESTDKAQLLRNMGLLQSVQGNRDEAIRYLEASLAMSESLNYDEGTANTAYVLANQSHLSGDYDNALKTYGRVLEIAKKQQDPLKQARTFSNMAAVLVEIADYSRAFEVATKASKLFATKGTDWDRLLNDFHLQSIQTYLGHFQKLDDSTLKLLAARLKSKHMEAYLDRLEGEGLRLQRDFQGALSCMEQARKKFQACQDDKEVLVTLLHEALTECLAGDLEAAQEKLKHWVVPDTLQVPEDIQGFYEILAGLLKRGEAPEAGWLEEKVQALLRSGQQEIVILTLLGCAEILTRLKDQEGAEFLRRKAYEWLESLYRQLPEEMQLSFERREDFKRLAESRRQKLKATGITREYFQTFAQINKQLSEEMEMSSVLKAVMDAAMALAGAERGFLLIQDETSPLPIIPGFRVEAARNMKKENIGTDEFKISLSVVEEALRRRVSILTDDAQADPNFRNAESVHLYQLKSILVLPLVSEKGCMGALYLDHRFEVGAFSEERLLFLKAFADQAVLAIEKAMTLAELQRAKQALENRVVEQAHQIEQMEVQLKEARKGLKYGYEEIVGHSPKMIQILKLLDRVTDTMVSVWIHGESGTGKELIARALHYNSDRKDKPFITENCSAIPENLLESVLFGHVKGAFTHADRDKMGLFEAANGGTIFLDEIGDMPMPMQSKLLRVLQEGEIRRVGSNESRPIDVRVVSATNKDLPGMVRSGKFREDLFFRLNGIKIELPSLKDRKEDIPPLVHHFIKKVAEENKLEPCGISEEALGVMAQYDWPGNIRELENAVRNAVLFSDGQTITREALAFKPELFEPPAKRRTPASEEEQVQKSSTPRTEEEAQREAILDALVRAAFHKGKAADELGVTPRHLYNLLEKYELPKNKWALKKLVEEERGFQEA